jgi:microsomal epoxide hydrolase
MAGYDSVPSGSRGDFVPFELRVSEDKISDFKQLLKLSPVGSATFENEQQDRRFGMPRRWLADTKEYWLNGFDWRSCEDHVNSFPNFRVTINDDNGVEFQIHFVALFSQRTDAIPIAFFHGWPGRLIFILPSRSPTSRTHA